MTSTGFWNNPTEALSVLNPLLALNSPSRDALNQLSTIDPYDGKTQGDSQIAYAFLQAAAKHIFHSVEPAAGTGSKTTADANSFDEKIEKVSELVGKAATICQPRSLISDSGILSALTSVQNHSISRSSVEFMQCALLAGQYRYASRVIGEVYPLPGIGVDVEITLRYFYLRGMIHIGCGDFQGAIRCFWTALSVPTENASMIAIDAWKKMVLAKCLVLKDSVVCQSLVSLPAGASTSLSRFLTGTSSSPPETTTSSGDSVGVGTYLELVKGYHAGDRQQFAKTRDENSALWENDRNTGLVDQLTTDLEHRCVLKFASVYSSLPLCRLASDLGKSEEDAFTTLRNIDGLSFKEDNGMIFFDATGACSMTAEDARSLMKLAETIRQLDVSIANSSKFQSTKVETGRPPRGVDDF